jgi:hypothetical protein
MTIYLVHLSRLRPVAPLPGIQFAGPERLPKMFPTGVDELGIFDDLVEFVLGAVAAHVVFLHDVVQTCPFTHAVDDVLKDLLLALGMVGVAEEHPLEKRLARGLVSDGH